jgi:hypothetical protein
MSLAGLPVLSQTKSAIELYKGNKESALQIHKDFTSRCIVLSQLKTALQWVSGNKLEALHTFHTFMERENLIVQAVLLASILLSPWLLVTIIHV